jgi:ethanolamine utilization protein EutP (predicted NTPase)
VKDPQAASVPSYNSLNDLTNPDAVFASSAVHDDDTNSQTASINEKDSYDDDTTGVSVNNNYLKQAGMTTLVDYDIVILIMLFRPSQM